MSKFIVMDIVFYAGSLNYDQGSGNYQELKKITKWDGKQYTFVSRYALRYSLLETGRRNNLWQIADADNLKSEGQGEQKVIQPSEDLLYSGEILKYPEFDLFGYLITSTAPQNFREAPVKISHAVSMTPFNYDAFFNANLGLANRMRKKFGEMKPNPFTAEEHMSYYQYSIVIDVERIGEIEVYKQLRGEEKKNIKLSYINGNVKIIGNDDEEILTLQSEGDLYYLSELILPVEKEKVEEWKKKINKSISNKIKSNPDSEVIIWKFKLKGSEKSNTPSPKAERIKKLVEAVWNLRRNIKARDEDLSPKLLILGLYKNKPYKTFKDKIMLKDEYREEEYDEIIEDEKDGKVIRKVIHKVSRSKKPVFGISSPELAENNKIQKEEVWSKIEKELLEASDGEVEKVYFFHEPDISIEFTKDSQENSVK